MATWKRSRVFHDALGEYLGVQFVLYIGMHNHGSKLKSSRRKLGSNTSGLRPNRIVKLDIDEGRYIT